MVGAGVMGRAQLWGEYTQKGGEGISKILGPFSYVRHCGKEDWVMVLEVCLAFMGRKEDPFR